MSFEVFSPIWSHVNENEKKNDLEIWGKGTFPPNLTLFCMMGSGKTGFTDDGRTTDARVTTVTLLCSSAQQS